MNIWALMIFIVSIFKGGFDFIKSKEFNKATKPVMFGSIMLVSSIIGTTLMKLV